MVKLAFCFSVLLLALVPGAALGVDLSVGILLANENQGIAFRELKQRFEKANPGVSLSIVSFTDREYKINLANWIRNRKGPDVFYWQAGERFTNLVDQGIATDITDVWQARKLDSAFPRNLKTSVLFGERVYGIPISFYHWGIYYKKSVFRKHNIEVPETWPQLMNAAEKLRVAGITPFGIGTKNQWPSAACFDYLNLRINGASYHRDLVRGNKRYSDDEVRKVFELWGALVNRKYFIENGNQFSWQQAMPLLYREKAGMLLMGNFVEKEIPEAFADDTGFFPFPNIDPRIPRAEVFPTELFVLGSWSENHDAGKALIAFLARSEIQRQMAASLGYLPAHRLRVGDLSTISTQGLELMRDSADTVQFFDREVEQRFGAVAIEVFTRFIVDGDVDRAISDLEAARVQFYP